MKDQEYYKAVVNDLVVLGEHIKDVVDNINDVKEEDMKYLRTISSEEGRSKLLEKAIDRHRDVRTVVMEITESLNTLI